jgi:hypothetical protein
MKLDIGLLKDPDEIALGVSLVRVSPEWRLIFDLLFFSLWFTFTDSRSVDTTDEQGHD